MQLAEQTLRNYPGPGLSDAEHNTWCEAENERLDQLFVESQNIARAHPEWFDDVEEPIKSQIIEIRDKTEWPSVCWRTGHVMRVDRVPEPEIADDFVRLVMTHIDAENSAREFDEMITAAQLGRHALRASVQRSLKSFTDFDRSAKTSEPDSTNPDNVRVFLKMENTDLRWNDWHQRIEIRETSSWATGRKELPWVALTDATIGRLMTLAGDSQYRFRPSEQLFRRAIEAIAREALFDPIVDYLADAEAKWDGVPRLATWLSQACGVPCDIYHQAVGKNVIGGMVKRARQPGAKHDEVMVLIGDQGTYKSTLCRALAWRDEFFTDSVAFDGSPQNLVPQLFGKWVVELGELDGMTNRETSFVKRFISAQADNVTLKYKAIAMDYARRCIFIGTSNDDRVLRDTTGNRRFLPVRVEQQINVKWVRENFDQIFGEAAAMHTAGATFEIPADVIPQAREHQDAARAGADYETFLDHWFSGDQPTLVAAADIAALLKEAVGRSVPANKYGTAMKRLGFVDGTVRLGGKPTWCWRRGQADQKNIVTLHRDNNGRLAPVQRSPFMPAVVSPFPLPGQNAVL